MNRTERIPNTFHFIFGLRPQAEPFHLVYYLCLKSCLEVNNPDEIYFHYYHEPHGPWWDRIKAELTLSKVEPLSFIDQTDLYDQHREGRLIKKLGLEYAHHSDFLRLKILIEQGGIYADIDTLFLKPYPKALFDFDFTLGRESPARTPDGGISSSLCNAVIFSRPDSTFAQAWLEGMYTYFDGSWNRHSCLLAAELMRDMPSKLHVAPRDYFYHYMWTIEDLHRLFIEDTPAPETIYSIHLWSHLWWERHRTDFTEFCADDITEDAIHSIDTTFNRLARPFLSLPYSELA